ncbi:unnamed protein product, partial [Rotaria sp. Silwood2]
MATNVTSERFLDADEESLAKSVSFEKYEKQPLVSFEEATQALKRLVDNLDKLVKMAKKKPFDQSVNLTKDEAAAIYLYTTKPEKSDKSVSIQLNQALRSGDQDQ